jgi:hypothetical protein
MRYVLGLVCALSVLVAVPQRVAAQTGHERPASAPVFIHAKRPPLPQFILRASYYYVDQVCPVGERYGRCAKPQATEAPANQSHEKKKLSRGAKAGIAVGVIAGATLIGLGVGAAVGLSNL